MLFIQTLQAYFAPFHQRNVRWGIGILLGLLSLTAIFTYLFQIASELPCSTECTCVAICGAIFWLGLLPQIMIYTDQQLKTVSNAWAWLKLFGMGLGLLLLNQLLIRAAILVIFQVVYGCTGTMHDWLTTILTNNILVNFLIYWGIVGLALGTRNSPVEAESIPKVHPGGVAKPEALTHLWIKNGAKSIALSVQDILWVASDNNCITIHTIQGRHVLYRSLRSLEADLDQGQFVRIHRSILVNKQAVSHVQNLPGGDAIAILHNGQNLRISRHLKAKALLMC